MPVMQQTDEAILNFIQSHWHTAFLDQIVPWITFLGNSGIIWIAVAVLLLFFKKYRSTGFWLLITLLICYLLNDVVLKPLIARPRPYDIHPDAVLLIPRLNEFSFPSGHASSSFAAATVIFLKNKRLGTAAYVLASMIAVSRLYLFMHYPSDVTAGALLGIGTAFLTVRFIPAMKNRLLPRKGE